RDDVRLMVAYRHDARLVPARFRDLATFLEPGDLLVINNSGTLPASVPALRADGTGLELHLSTPLPSGSGPVDLLRPPGRDSPVSYYQTVFAMEAGSAEIPSAGRAFTPEIVTDLISRGIDVAPITLHAGVASLEEHEAPPAEFYRVPQASARRVSLAREAG